MNQTTIQSLISLCLIGLGLSMPAVLTGPECREENFDCCGNHSAGQRCTATDTVCWYSDLCSNPPCAMVGCRPCVTAHHYRPSSFTPPYLGRPEQETQASCKPCCPGMKVGDLCNGGKFEGGGGYWACLEYELPSLGVNHLVCTEVRDDDDQVDCVFPGSNDDVKPLSYGM
eukprot:gb/GEZN01015800.1/.p1 GENE.gb/GEZN01015800.1/~~gb/GEZN01015800.1/.p1  ORF type:complete len:171 (+),score=7.45 gb/GEZN01015800.1/:66-578(+)